MLALSLLLLAAAPAPKTVAPAPNGEVEKLRAEVASLRERLEKLERRFAEEDQARETKAANAALIRSTLESVHKQLSSGDTRNVDAQLKNIERIATGDTLKLITTARSLLSQNDLANARATLQLALALTN